VTTRQLHIRFKGGGRVEEDRRGLIKFPDKSSQVWSCDSGHPIIDKK